MSDSYTVAPGDSYERIARLMYGDGRMFAELMAANGGVPLHPGMQLVLPPKIDNPFVSNEKAAEFGMATAQQYADMYKAGGGKVNWTKDLAAMNRKWAQDNYYGIAPGLVNGQLPTGYNGAQMVSGSGTLTGGPTGGLSGTPATKKLDRTGMINKKIPISDDISTVLPQGFGPPAPRLKPPVSWQTPQMSNYGSLKTPNWVEKTIIGAQNKLSGAINKQKSQKVIQDFETRRYGKVNQPPKIVEKPLLDASSVIPSPSPKTTPTNTVPTASNTLSGGVGNVPKGNAVAKRLPPADDVNLLNQQLYMVATGQSTKWPDAISGDALFTLGRANFMKTQSEIVDWALENDYVYDMASDTWKQKSVLPNLLPEISDEDGNVMTLEPASDEWWGGMYGLKQNYYANNDVYGNSNDTYTGRPTKIDANSIFAGLVNYRYATG